MLTRKRNRLPDNKIYQASNTYFITITTKNRLSIFGHVVQPIAGVVSNPNQHIPIAGVGEKFISPGVSHVVSPAIPNPSLPTIPPTPTDSTNTTKQSGYNPTSTSQSPNNHPAQPSHYNTAGEINFSPTPAIHATQLDRVNFSPTPAMGHDGGKMIHSWIGEIVQNTWLDLPNQFSNIVLDEFVVMPNHFHAIITFFGKPVFIRSGKESDLSKIIKHFKSLSTLQIKNQQRTILSQNAVVGEKLIYPAIPATISPTDSYISNPALGNIPTQQSPNNQPSIASHYSPAGEINFSPTNAIQCLFENYSTIWHKSYYDNVIRNEKSLSTIQQYIRDNPMKWHLNMQKIIK